MSFDEVIGQKEAEERLLQLVRKERLPHALMLCGPQGCGKLPLAVAFACYLLDNGTPSAKAMLAKLEHPDLHFTYPTIKLPSMGAEHKPVSDDFAKDWHELVMRGLYFTMEEWMTAMGAENQQAIITAGESDDLVRKLSLKSSQGGYKVSVIWLPERMNIECANKLLKLIEEPPSQTVFLLVSENPAALLETIRSRTQLFAMTRIGIEDVEKALVEKRGVDAEAAHRIARFSEGSWLKALDALDAGSENHEFLNDFMQMTRMSFTRNVAGMTQWSLNVTKYGREKQRRMLNYFVRMIRESFVYNFHIPDLSYMSLEEENFVRRFAPYVNELNVIQLAENMTKAGEDIGRNANARMVFFDVALQTTVLLRAKA